MIYVEGSEYVEKNGVVEKNNNYNIKSNLNNRKYLCILINSNIVKYLNYEKIESF